MTDRETLQLRCGERVTVTRAAADARDGLTVQQADALWDAVAVPGPRTPTYPEQYERVCRAVAAILAEQAIRTDLESDCPDSPSGHPDTPPADTPSQPR
ncbi:hypothetical protein [Streptomyces sp. NRRL B-1347]|uniref:hypothetical protein n=1 Tax=Streptomyces sp. NRRL B-1347 TaxID=1476877 RepID=UPI0004CB9E45|nr:hypothetical protein [Streptomyces sp. NRRL B-1347]